jgi:hypothetical protein
MHTLNLKEAATFLRMNPATLRQKAKTAVTPGAKAGEVLGVYRSRSCTLSAEFIFSFPASAAKWL